MSKEQKYHDAQTSNDQKVQQIKNCTFCFGKGFVIETYDENYYVDVPFGESYLGVRTHYKQIPCPYCNQS